MQTQFLVWLLILKMVSARFKMVLPIRSSETKMHTKIPCKTPKPVHEANNDRPPHD